MFSDRTESEDEDQGELYTAYYCVVAALRNQVSILTCDTLSIPCLGFSAYCPFAFDKVCPECGLIGRGIRQDRGMLPTRGKVVAFAGHPTGQRSRLSPSVYEFESGTRV